MKGRWMRDHKGRIYRWKCRCGQRPLDVLACPHCGDHQPLPPGHKKPLDKAFEIIDSQLKKDKP